MAKKKFYKQSAVVDASSTTTVLEVNKPAKFLKAFPKIDTGRVYANPWKSWFLVAFLLFSLVFLVSMSLMGWWYMRTFYQETGVAPLEVVRSAVALEDDELYGTKGYVSLLLLGLDQSDNQRSNSMLTDTIMVITIPRQGEVKTLSVPRDLWIESLKTKVNALYYYGKQTNPDDGVSLVSSVLNEITGLAIDYSILISMDTLRETIDALGGVEVVVERQFSDSFYPREIDVTSKDPAILYKTISFEKGPQLMDGETALQFIRSRKSADLIEGTDTGRERRQQLLMTSLIQKLTDPQLLSNPKRAAALYSVWNTHVTTTLSDEVALRLGIETVLAGRTFEPIAVPIEDKQVKGLLYHPPAINGQQWMYVPVDPTWTELRSWIAKTMLGN
jgi:LCP family protein required for cell wall assembly